jgi:hypothetical protein
MDRSAWRHVGIGLGLSMLSVLLAFAGAWSIEEPLQQPVFVAVLSPLFLALRGVTSLFDYLGPPGLAEPWSQYAPRSLVWVLIGLSIGFFLVGMVALANVASRWGARVAFGLWLILSGFNLATNGLSDSPAESVRSLPGLCGVALGVTGMYLLAAGVSCRLKTSRVARLAALGCLSAAIFAGTWLAYVSWLNGRS